MFSSTRNRIIALLLLLVVLFATGFRVGHPQDGLKNALGSAKSGVVIYKTGADFKAGEKVMVNLENTDASPIIAFIVTADAENVQIQSGTEGVTVKKQQVYGTLIAVIPFIGSILSVIGL
ncbi:unannotated protein [freshwater metagenome]|uniref:Unannotated protein n=1 Tax=freshwater metagenome TaxID=449393 RepID=A0A6J5Z529_9ZZZZ|nr:hypothetical protein [Actinomycetota bacterium]